MAGSKLPPKTSKTTWKPVILVQFLSGSFHLNTQQDKAWILVFGCLVLGRLLYSAQKGCNYSRGSNTKHLNTESIRKPNVLKVCFRMVQPFENQTFYHSKTEHSNGRFSLDHFIYNFFIYYYIKRSRLKRPF